MTYEYVYVRRFMFLYMFLFVCCLLFVIGTLPKQTPIFGGPRNPFLWKTAKKISRFQASTTTDIKDLGKPKWQYPTQEGTCWPCCFCLEGGKVHGFLTRLRDRNIPGLCFLWTRKEGPLGERNRRISKAMSRAFWDAESAQAPILLLLGPSVLVRVPYLSFDLHSLPFRSYVLRV